MNKVLVFANDFTTIYNFRRELIEKLTQQGYQVVLALPPSVKNIYFTKRGYKVLDTPLERKGINPIKEFKLLLCYKKHIKEERPDIVLTYTVKPNIYGGIACGLHNIPCINNVTGLGSGFQRQNIIKQIMILLQKIAYKKSNCVFFQNIENLEAFSEKGIVKAETAVLIPGSGVNITLNNYEKYPPRGAIKFITVSRVREDKGFSNLLEAAYFIKEKYPETEFHVVGAIEDKEYIEKFKESSENGTIIYHGVKKQEDVHELIKNCHCLIHPSYHEGMANAILEAEATGRPCLVTDISGCREAVEDGITGYLFKVKNTQSLINTIIQFIELDYEKQKLMGKKAHEKVVEEFNRNIVVNAYFKEIEKILNIEVNLNEFV